MLENLTIHDWIQIIGSGIEILLIFLILRWNHLLLKISKIRSPKVEHEEFEDDNNM